VGLPSFYASLRAGGNVCFTTTPQRPGSQDTVPERVDHACRRALGLWLDVLRHPLFSTNALGLLLLLFPLGIAIAILRYQLFDIDIIIRRTLVYSTLTVMLAVIYEASVFTLQFLTSGLIRGNQLAIIASTFLIGVLFKPLHDRTQKLIDRRFYRRKYDAAKTLATFSTTIRDEVDLNQLGMKLMTVVEETLQPTHVSLWLRPSQWRKEGQLHHLEDQSHSNTTLLDRSGEIERGGEVHG
jgi:hypothetical protein